MKKVLIVDDEDDMLWMLQRNLDNGIPNIETFTAQSGEDALHIVKENEIDLIITDINMPGMSGLELLTEVSSSFPDTQVIIMTAYPSNTFESKAKKDGAIHFVEKPFDVNDMRKLVEKTLEDPGNAKGAGSIALLDLIQFNGLAKATSALRIHHNAKEGFIFFQDGLVAHAMFGNLSGEEAFFHIIEIQDAEINNVNDTQPPVVSINKSVESLLLEAAVIKDENSVLENTSGTNAFIAPENQPAIAEEQKDDEEVEEPVESNSALIDSDQTEDNDMTDIQKVLSEFTNIDGVHTACLVGRDGFLLDSLARTGIDAEMIGAIASSGFGSAETMGSQLGQGELNMTMLEYTEGPVMFAPVGDEAFLVIVADKETNLGWIRIAIKKNTAKIEQIASI